MAQQLIQLGASANDKTGDTLRTGGEKINANFAELYRSIGYTLPQASTTTLGGVKVDGSSITINNGIISAAAGAGSNYILPTATTNSLGGVRVDGTTITITNGVISAVAGTGGGGASVIADSVAPGAPEPGDLWYDTNDGRMYVYYDSAWVDSSPAVTENIHSTYDVMPGDTVDFPSFSGQILVNDHSATGQLDLWLCGGGFATRLGTSKDSDSSAVNQGSFAHNSGIDGYTWTSNLTGTVAFTATRTRLGA